MAAPQGRRSVIAYAAVALFLLVDAVLITTALSPTPVDAATDASSTARPTASALSTPPSPTPSATTTAAPAVAPAPATRLLSAVSDTAAWRATTGPCPATAASPELSTDAGESWIASDATGPSGATALQNITALSESVAEFVGLDEDCAPQFIKTFVGGDNYTSYPVELEDAWYVDPADRATVHGPDGDAPAPCDSVVHLAASTSDSAAVLCADGRLFTTADAAATWSAPVALPGMVTLTATDTGYLAVVTSADPTDCRGVNIVPLTETLEAAGATCFETDLAPTALAGNVAVSTADDTLWLWIGDATLRLTAAGEPQP
ncbi:hypothetical protein [Cryobacterium sp. Y11]|uniref:hypothetical protein n=1 Tax=Cryobacterium sp. Y11 TaxID=2045016 RepID=UPI000CE32D5E|nr:hypothetical protein [Cryobacterium sp. Y11]